MPLTGIKVIDLTRILSGPFCTMLLADMGAEVIKIEPPREGDPLRTQGAMRDGLSWYYASFNRNKKSVTLDLYSPEGKEILESLIKKSDVVVDNFRPGVMEKMGFGYTRLKDMKSDIVYCGLSGFGKGGPYKDRPAFDFIIQAMSGLMSLNGKEGEEPIRVGIPISDLIGGLYAAFGITVALWNRSKTGQGQEIETSLLDGILSFFAYMSANYFATGQLPRRTGNDHPIIAPYGVFRAKDGDIAIAPSSEQIYQKFIESLGLIRLNQDADFSTNERRMANREKTNAIIQEKIGAQSREYWIEYLNRSGIPCGIIMNLSEVFNDPQVRHQQMVLEIDHPEYGRVRMTGFPVKLSSTPCQVRLPAPRLGEHTEEVLKELGMTQETFSALRKRGVI
ncbi:MAG: carnitine dehydratase [Deltaproteobacteria bacterium SM23_61]|nr:MAG: carnitine dehydratase [Deltaproteobacteria bacterium SM23_61]